MSFKHLIGNLEFRLDVLNVYCLIVGFSSKEALEYHWESPGY